ncbi:MAG: hypothetical protein BWZ10_02326 [candidate division BRC1 bacterium ADurb.BinA364]|nr:MAG: hypothetical protein BWZ10_02326 [candidate division BRC1 bacterium ADurb.BinA364]
MFRAAERQNQPQIVNGLPGLDLALVPKQPIARPGEIQFVKKGELLGRAPARQGPDMQSRIRDVARLAGCLQAVAPPCLQGRKAANPPADFLGVARSANGQSQAPGFGTHGQQGPGLLALRPLRPSPRIFEQIAHRAHCCPASSPKSHRAGGGQPLRHAGRDCRTAPAKAQCNLRPGCGWQGAGLSPRDRNALASAEIPFEDFANCSSIASFCIG